ncbi:uncharacterized protein LOC133917279 [Phragmites australis]|uniref:uncharacterized protein LOC133917279 n=1 Tax=Phragmites australis TaxID=29695 RepID=UPI002D76BBF6|nr:uncharacterized protein LOC133917279 [Phragmites australis]
MLRRIQRKQWEYMYEITLEGSERAWFEKKCRLWEALEEGKPIPTDLCNKEHELQRQIDLDDQERAIPRSNIDDEYAIATTREPKILLTTSHNPSMPLTQFVKDLKVVFLNSQRMNRGGQDGNDPARDQTLEEDEPKTAIKIVNDVMSEFIGSSQVANSSSTTRIRELEEIVQEQRL